MSTPRPSPRSRRDRPAKPPLSLEAIVDESLRIVATDGLGSLSMRRVALGLDTGAGSLYVYVSGRDELLALVLDRALADLPMEDPAPDHWRAQLHRTLLAVRESLTQHPGLAEHLMVDPPRSESVMRLLENLLGLLFAGGLGPSDAAWTADALLAQVTFGAIEAQTRQASEAELVETVRSDFASLPADRFPLVTANAEALTSGTVDARFTFAVDALIDGALLRR